VLLGPVAEGAARVRLLLRHVHGYHEDGVRTAGKRRGNTFVQTKENTHSLTHQ
jgi:hypothetical protein